LQHDEEATRVEANLLGQMLGDPEITPRVLLGDSLTQASFTSIWSNFCFYQILQYMLPEASHNPKKECSSPKRNPRTFEGDSPTSHFSRGIPTGQKEL